MKMLFVVLKWLGRLAGVVIRRRGTEKAVVTRTTRPLGRRDYVLALKRAAGRNRCDWESAYFLEGTTLPAGWVWLVEPEDGAETEEATEEDLRARRIDNYEQACVLADLGIRIELWYDSDGPYGPAPLVRLRCRVEGVEYGYEKSILLDDGLTIGHAVDLAATGLLQAISREGQ